jgi:hypothetical protein
VKLLVRRLFAKKSEKRNEATDRPRDKSQEEALLFSQATFPTPEKRDDQCPAPEEPVVDHRLTEADLANESSLRGFSNPKASDWKSLEIFDESSKIQIIERSYVKEKHRRYKYKYLGDESPEKEVIVTAPGPGELLPGMSYTTEFGVYIINGGT